MASGEGVVGTGAGHRAADHTVAVAAGRAVVGNRTGRTELVGLAEAGVADIEPAVGVFLTLPRDFTLF